MLLKYILIGIKENKKRLLLVILSISITAALLYITLFFNESVQLDALKTMNSEYGETDIIVTSNNQEKFYFMDNEVEDQNIKELVPLCYIDGTYDTQDSTYDVGLIGIKEADLGKLVDYTVVSEDINEQGNLAQISQTASKKYGLKLGDDFRVTVGGNQYKLTISKIVKNEGYLYDESAQMKVLVSYDFANEMLGKKDAFNLAYINLEDNSEEARKETISRIEKKYKDLYFREVDTSLVSSSINANLTLPLLIILIVSCLMSALIIYTTSNIVLLERMPVIGTFLSVGMRYGKVIATLLLEALIQGALGGLIGWGIGIFTSAVLTDSSFSGITLEWLKSINVDVVYGALSIVFAMALSIVSMLLSVQKLTKIPIKAIILGLDTLNNRQNTMSGMIIRIAIPALLGITAFVIKGTVMSSIAIILAAILAIILIIPLFLEFISCHVIGVLRNKLPLVYLSCKNVLTTKMLISNMYLISITLTIILLIGTISTAVISGFDELFSGYNSDVAILLHGEQKDVYDFVKSDPQVKDYYYFYSYNNMPVKGSSNISLVQGVEYQKYAEFNTYFSYVDDPDVLNKLKSDERNILLSLALLDKYRKKVGDEITLMTPDNKPVTYTIAGRFNAKMAYLGSFALISIENMKKDFNILYPNSISIKLKEKVDVNAYYNKVKKSDIRENIQSVVLESTKKEQDIAMTSSFLNIIESISIITIILAIIGILNNFIISFIQRKKVFATFDSIGISKSGKNTVMLLESVFVGIISITVSAFSYLIITSNIQGILHFIGVYINVTVNVEMFFIYSLIVFVNVMLSGVFMKLKANKLSIIDELRYE